MTGRRGKLRRRAVLGALLGLVILAAFLALAVGSVPIAFSEILHALTVPDDAGTAAILVRTVRLPRVLAAVLAGIGLAAAGVILQGVTGNALASPNVIGVNAGAGLAVMGFLCFLPRAYPLLPAAAFIGAFLTTLVILALGNRARHSRMTLILAGVAVSAIFNAGISALTLFFPDLLVSYNAFSIGGFSGVLGSRLYAPGALILAGTGWACVRAGRLNALTLGDEIARSLGVNVRGERLGFLMLASALAGSVVSFAGLIGFVGLIVPHVARKLVGADARAVLPASALLGALLLLLADLLGRSAFAPYEMPVGILTALMGGPFFLALLLRRREEW